MGRRFMFLLFFLIGVSIVFVGCGDSEPSAGPSEILIGINAPLTGIHAGFGEGNVYGELAAIDDINELGGVYIEEYERKIPVRAIVVDNESDPARAMTLEENLITQDNVHFLVPPNQPLPLAVPEAIIAERYKVPRVSGGTPMEPWLEARAEASPVWNHTFTYSFNIAAPAPEGSYFDQPGYTVNDTWKAFLDECGTQTNMKVGVLASDETDGRGWYATLPPMLQEWGYDVVGIDKNLGLFPEDTTDFSSIISEWQENDVEMILGNCPGPLFGALWRQARSMGFAPKIVVVGRAALYYNDVSAWGGDLPLGVGTEVWWDPSWEGLPGIGDTTPASLFERWKEDTKKPLDPGIGWGYHSMQIMLDAIERAGSLDSEKVVQALRETDMATISTPRVIFDEFNSSRMPLAFGQWFKTDQPWVWECKTVSSEHDFAPVMADPLFPIPYE